MPSTINADDGVISGSAGVKTSADASGELALQSNGTTVATLSASGGARMALSGSMVALAFKAIQELKAENDALKARIEALETK